MRVLAISSADGGAAVAMVEQGETVAGGRLPDGYGLAAALPELVAGLLAGHGAGIGLVAVVVGPGSFTGVRAGLSVAYGVGLGRRIPVIGVTVAEALADEAGRSSAAGLVGRTLWTAIHARRGRVFIESAGSLHGYSTDALPVCIGRIAVCGNAANLVAGALAARGADVMLTAYRAVRPVHVAMVALARLSDGLFLPPALPLYVDEAEAKLPKAGLRPSPDRLTTA